MPCLNTIRTVLQDVVPLDELETLFRRYLHDTYGGQESRLITIDGKTMRGTIPKGSTQGIHLLAAYLPEEGVVLKQVAVATKENEISAAPQLLEGINIKNKVICADAMQTQRKLSVDVLSRGGDYIWFLKDNQPMQLEDVKQIFKPARMSAGWHPPEQPRIVAKTTEIGHGRLEKRTLILMEDEEQFLDWPGVRQVFKLKRETTRLRTGRETTEFAYGITSCTPEATTTKQMLQWTRQYWGIEKGLHYRRDVTLREDATRISQPTLAKTLSAINNFAAARRLFDAQITIQIS